MTNWDIKFIEMSNQVADWSKDPNRKVGAIVVDDDNIVLSVGYNDLPRGVKHEQYRYDRPQKYMFIEHAERNAIYHAARNGVKLKGCSMYVTLFCCADCARGIIQAGIKKVYSPAPDVDHETWGEHFKVSLTMFEEANVEVIFID